MTTETTRFTPEDWSAIVAAPLLTAMWIVAGRRRRGRAMLAVLRAYRDAQAAYDTELLRELLAGSPAGAIERPKDPAALRREAPAELRRAVEALERATPDERAEYRRFVLSLAEAAAAAARGGGLLRRPREASGDERDTLRSIGAILGA